MLVWRIIILVFSCSWFSSSAAHAITTPGTVIDNQATISYEDAMAGKVTERLSNISSLWVSELLQFELLGAQSLMASPGETVYFSHQLINTGNVDLSIVMLVENTFSDNGELYNLMLHQDFNGNGSIDSLDTIIQGDVQLQRSQTMNMVVSGLVPGNALSKETIEIQVLAQLNDSTGLSQSNIDQVSLSPKSGISVQLISDVSCSEPLGAGDALNVKLEAENLIEESPLAKQVIVEGVQYTGVLLEIPLPDEIGLEHNVFLDMSDYPSIAIVQEEASSGLWMRYENWSGERKLARFALLSSPSIFSKDEKLSVDLPLQVSVVDQTKTVLLQGLVDQNADGESDAQSRELCVQLVPTAYSTKAQAIRFIEPALSLQRTGEAPSYTNNSDFIDAATFRLHQSSSDVPQNETFSDDIIESVNTDYALVSNGVYIQLDTVLPEMQVIRNDEGVRFVIVRLTATDTGDVLQVLLRETYTNSAVYRSIRPVLLSSVYAGEGRYCPGDQHSGLPSPPDYLSSHNSCILQSQVNDLITVTFSNELTGQTFSDTALVEPVARVFNATTLEGIPNATVHVMSEGRIALDLISNEPLIFSSDDLGRYTIPRLNVGEQYSFVVEPPDGFEFPSLIAPEQFQTLNVTQASYGVQGYQQQGRGLFSVEQGYAAPAIDIPLDLSNGHHLLELKKVASVGEVELGELVSYSIFVKNLGDSALQDVTVLDFPSRGFKFIESSATFDGEAIAEPQPLQVPKGSASIVRSSNTLNGLRFSLGELAANSTGVLNYHMQVSAGALEGDGSNTAIANAYSLSGLVLSSDASTTQVQVQRTGIMSNTGILIGKVFVDSQCDGIQNLGEWPISGVRLYLQNGQSVYTDEDGLFHLSDLHAGSYVLRVDPLTLPEGLLLKSLDNRQAADPASRFVDLVSGELQRADFAARCPQSNAEVAMTGLEQRRLLWRTQGVVREDKSKTVTDSDVAVSASPKTVSLSSSIDGPSQVKRIVTAKQANIMTDPNVLAATITHEQAQHGAWLWPQEDVSWDGRFMVVVPVGVEPRLFVNGVPVAASQLGEHIINHRAQAQLLVWYGVALKPGQNQVSVRGIDPFGNERLLAEKEFKKPTAGVRLILRAAHNTLEADGGNSQLPIEVSVLDANGNPANGVYFVSLRSSAGEFLETDLQSQESGLQIRVENGLETVHLLSTTATGVVTVQASSGAMQASLPVVQIAAARPLIAVGLMQLNGHWDANSTGDVQAIQTLQAEARSAFFLKGSVKQGMQLTLAYDSAKRAQDSSFNNSDINQNYTGYGDASVYAMDADAQSRSPLYAKLERARNSIMWGDYLTDDQTEAMDVAAVQRTLTGVNGVVVDGGSDGGEARLQVFASQAASAHTIEELRGNGTSMLFNLEAAPAVVGSESVYRVVKDRHNPNIVLSTVLLQRDNDYRITYQSGHLVFNETIPTVDEDLNPVFIRVSYDKTTQTNHYNVAGVRLTLPFSDSAGVGVSVTADQNPLSAYTIAGVHASTDLTLNTRMQASAGIQRFENRRSGDAQRVRVEHVWGDRQGVQTLLSWSRASEHFNNPSSGLGAGNTQWQAQHRQPLGNTSKLLIEANHSRSLLQQQHYTGASLSVDKTVSTWQFSGALKHVDSVEGGQWLSFNTVLLGAQKRMTFTPEKWGSLGSEYERDWTEATRYRVGLSAQAQLSRHVSVYTKLNSEYGLSAQSYYSDASYSRSITAGVESQVMPSTTVFSEYRLNEQTHDATVASANGFRSRFEWVPKLILTPSLEVIDVLKGQAEQSAVAVSIGLDDKRNVNRKVSVQAEFRGASSLRYYGFRASVAQRINSDWSALFKEELTKQVNDGEPVSLHHQVSIGLSRRPKYKNKHHLLLMANGIQEHVLEDSWSKRGYVLSLHQNTQFSRDFVVNGRLGAKWSKTRFQFGGVVTRALLADVRAIKDLNRRWDIDIRAGVLSTGGGDEMRYSLGTGLSWLADRNVRLGLSYNVTGFKDKELDAFSFNRQGVHVGLQVKLDEEWFRWLE